MEKIDAKDRENNLVVTGVPEDTYLGVETDVEKLAKILEKLDNIEPADAFIRTKRLGEQVPGKNRPILCVLGSVVSRDRVVNAARNASLGGVRMKKDAHPAVRAEWKRLFDYCCCCDEIDNAMSCLVYLCVQYLVIIKPIYHDSSDYHIYLTY